MKRYLHILIIIMKKRGTAHLGLIFENFVHFLKNKAILNKVSYGSG